MLHHYYLHSLTLRPKHIGVKDDQTKQNVAHLKPSRYVSKGSVRPGKKCCNNYEIYKSWKTKSKFNFETLYYTFNMFCCFILPTRLCLKFV